MTSRRGAGPRSRPRGRARPRSLSQHLASPASPLYSWLAERLRHTVRVSRRANTTLGTRARAVPVPRVPDADPGLVGTAADLLLRAALVPGGLATSEAARVGGRVAIGSGPPLTASLGDVLAEASALAPGVAAAGGVDDWARLGALMVTLGRFEQATRSLSAHRSVAERLRPTPAPSPVVLVERLADRADVEDLIGVARASWPWVRDLATEGDLATAPRFDIPGVLLADGDLLAGDLLVDFKATTQRTVVDRDVLWQLAGYVLADHEDRHGIRRVGVAALRWGGMAVWDVDELLGALSDLWRGADRATLTQEFLVAARAGAAR